MLTSILFIIGLLLFLLGLYTLKLGLRGLNSFNFKKIISSFTKTPLWGFFTGTFLTMVLQSSSAVTVISISLVDTGLMTFNQAIGIVLGTNIGTTLTGQIMAFNLEIYGKPLFLSGIILLILTKKTLRLWGINLIGLGCIFIGMDYMGKAFLFIRENPFFYHLLLLTSKSTTIAVLFGIIFTAIIQSSSAMTGIILVLAKNGQIDLLTATAIILGSNVGTCVTAILASIGSTLGGKRVALAHVILNLLGVFIFMPFIKEFVYLISLFSNDLPRQIAHIHTVFNIVCSLAVLPFANAFAGFICWLIPDS